MSFFHHSKFQLFPSFWLYFWGIVPMTFQVRALLFIMHAWRKLKAIKNIDIHYINWGSIFLKVRHIYGSAFSWYWDNCADWILLIYWNLAVGLQITTVKILADINFGGSVRGRFASVKYWQILIWWLQRQTTKPPNFPVIQYLHIIIIIMIIINMCAWIDLYLCRAHEGSLHWCSNTISIK